MPGYKDIFTTAITLLVVAFFWLAALFLKGIGLQGRFTRNFLHFIAGLWGILWLQFESPWVASGIAFLGFLFLSLVIFFRDFPLFRDLAQPFSLSQEGKWGVALYSLSLFLITSIFWGEKSIGTSLIFSLALGDGMADAVGSRWGKIRLPLPWNRDKTLEGSIACFLGGIAGICLGFLLSGRTIPLIPLLFGGLICSVVEGMSPPELDNLFVPAFLGAFLLLVA